MNITTIQPSGYGFHCVLREADFAKALAAVTAALKDEGFGVLTKIDVQAEPNFGRPVCGATVHRQRNFAADTR